jgi:putative transposase
MVMPNHIHGIVEIVQPFVVAQHAAPLQKRVPTAPRTLEMPVLSTIIRSFKAEATRRARLELTICGNIWQRNYYDRVIRDGQEFSNALRYIEENPLRWQRQEKQMVAEGETKTDGLAQPAAPLQRDRA